MVEGGHAGYARSRLAVEWEEVVVEESRASRAYQLFNKADKMGYRYNVRRTLVMFLVLREGVGSHAGILGTLRSPLARD